ncbi:hypothetical protein [Thiobacillus sp.]
MAVAAAGAAISLLIVALVHWRYDPAFGSDLRVSLKIDHGDRPLGEQTLWAMRRNWRRR